MGNYCQLDGQNEHDTALDRDLLKYNQKKLIIYLENLNDEQRKQFKILLQKIDFEKIYNLHKNIYSKSEKKEFKSIQPITTKITQEDLKKDTQFQSLGVQAIWNKQVAICTLAGGQASRLDYDHPKGLYNPNLQSNKTIFHYLANNLIALTNLINKTKQQGYKPQSKQQLQQILQQAKKKVDSQVISPINTLEPKTQSHNNPPSQKSLELLTPWAIMVNNQTLIQVKQYFQKQNYFGISRNSICIFAQKTLPALSLKGQVIIDKKSSIFMSPNGNGGFLSSFKQQGIMDQFIKQGVKYLNVLAVDNIMVRHADPFFVGYHIKNQNTLSSKYLRKIDPDENVGVHALIDGQPGVIQYTQLPQEKRNQKKQDGSLKFQDAYIGMFIVDLKFISQLWSDIQKKDKLNSMYHFIEKRIPELQGQQTVMPQENNGIIFQLFIFDFFNLVDKIGLVQTTRQQQFSPIKNKDGTDSPQSLRAAISKLHKSYLQKYGLKFQQNQDQKYLIEIDNRLTYRGEGLQQLIQQQKDKIIRTNFYLRRQQK